MQNITWFLLVLEKEFGIADKFQIADLYNYNNLQAVLNVLAKISQVQSLNFEFWHVQYNFFDIKSFSYYVFC